ncbi:MAG: polymer-forming cytoskeletal protein [Pseudomonadota bacterium]
MKQPGNMVIMGHTSISGKISNCGVLEVHGYIDGIVAAQRVIVHQTGQLYGTIEADDAEIHGEMQGEVKIHNLITIGNNGSVSGNIQYGKLAVEAGGNLSADIRNVPPKITGDFDITVHRGKSVRITQLDLSAIDPDDSAQNLTFKISNATSGFVAKSGTTTLPLQSFTQADLQSGSIIFVHDGSLGDKASFDVVVTDASGATSGKSKTVNVNVQ